MSHFCMQDKSWNKLAKNNVLWNNDPFQLLKLTMLMTMKPQTWIIIIDECIVDNIVEYE